MATQFTQGTSSYGAWTQYGYRVGPTASPGSSRQAFANAFGLGMPYGSLFTYSITPVANVAQNIAPQLTLSATPGWVPMNTAPVEGDKAVSFFYGWSAVPYGETPDQTPTQTNAQGILALQLQYPCCLGWSTNATVDSYVTFFGYDWYGQSMQEKVNINTQTQTSSAFYGVVGIWSDAAAEGSTFSVGTTQTYGLPYLLKSSTQVVAYAESVNLPETWASNFVGGQTLVTETSGDVRGLFSANITPTGTVPYTATYFVDGGNTWNAITAAFSRGNNPSQTPWAPTLQQDAPALRDLIGPAPFYFGQLTS